MGLAAAKSRPSKCVLIFMYSTPFQWHGFIHVAEPWDTNLVIMAIVIVVRIILVPLETLRDYMKKILLDN